MVEKSPRLEPIGLQPWSVNHMCLYHAQSSRNSRFRNLPTASDYRFETYCQGPRLLKLTEAEKVKYRNRLFTS
jgi:hypothetical protein